MSPQGGGPWGYRLTHITKTCNLTHLWLHSGPPTATYSTWTVQRKRTVQKRFGGAPEAPLERPASPRTASGGGAEPSSHAWSGGKPPHKQTIASRGHTNPTVHFREPYGSRSRETDVFEPV